MTDTSIPEVDDFFAELNAEIAEATAKSRLRLDAAKLRKTAANMRLSQKVRAAAAAEYAVIQAIVEANMWEPVASGALFSEQTCDGCGSTHHTFLQFMELQKKVRDRNHTTRWIRVMLPQPGLPYETIVQPLTTHICSDCCEEHGFNAKAPTIRLLPRDENLTVSSTYVQGDINAPEGE